MKHTIRNCFEFMLTDHKQAIAEFIVTLYNFEANQSQIFWAVTNVGRTCGPTLLLLHLYAKAIKYV